MADEAERSEARNPSETNPIRKLREELLMTREELAARAGVSLRTVWSVENGRRCRVPTKRRILHALGIAKRRHREVFPKGAEAPAPGFAEGALRFHPAR